MFILKNGFEEKLAPELERLESLVADMRHIVAGGTPTAEQLDAAPCISNVTIGLRQHACLNGIAVGHPILGSTKIRTSDLWIYAPEQRWARTYSRFYRLGPYEDLTNHVADF